MNLKKFRRLTAYDTEKSKKMNNFNLLNSKYCKTAQTVLAGDSITEIFNMELLDDYTQRSGKRVYNRGISGDTSDRLLERYEANVLSLQPEDIVLLIGTNDLTIKADVDYVLGNIHSILSLTSDRLPSTRTIVQAVYPVEYRNKKKNERVVQLNAGIEALCRDMGAQYVDTYTPLLDNKGGFCTEYTYDGLHPNARGFEVVAEIISAALMTK